MLKDVKQNNVLLKSNKACMVKHDISQFSYNFLFILYNRRRHGIIIIISRYLKLPFLFSLTMGNCYTNIFITKRKLTAYGYCIPAAVILVYNKVFFLL